MPSQMSFWMFILLTRSATTESRLVKGINPTDLRKALGDMRLRSYHGFVILRRIMKANAGSLHKLDVTFVMPNDEEILRLLITQCNLEDFILSHTIAAALTMDGLLHFPNGTLVPTSVPDRMMSVTNNGRSGLFLNHARIVTPNVCLSSLIRCHGISSTINFEVPNPSASPFEVSLQATGQKKSSTRRNQAPDDFAVQPKGAYPLH